MTRSPILFRVDADPKMGFASLHRCQVFAAALQRRRRTAHFLSKIDPNHLVLPLKRGGNEWLAHECAAGTADDAKNTVAHARRLGCLAVVVDLPNVTPQFLAILEKANLLVVCIDHRAQTKYTSGMVINPLAGPSKVDYSYDENVQLLLGERYALVRSEIRRARPLRAQEPQSAFRLMVALGDHDPERQTLPLVKTLLGCNRLAKIDVAVRSWHPDLKELEELVAENGERVSLAMESNEVGHRLIRCHLAITSGDAWSLEFATVGVPQLIMVQDESLWPCARRLEEEGVATILGSAQTVSPSTAKGAVADLLANPQERQSMTRNGRSLVDSRGPDRLVVALEVMLQPWLKATEAAAAA